MSKAISVHNNASYTKGSIDDIIADLRVVIDQIGHSQAHAKDLILELATLFDENNACQQGQICKKIKEILSDKIKERKITGRWVERCLPAEYKGKYDKSELSSLSSGCKRNSTKDAAKSSVKLDGLAFENAELKEALKRQTVLLSADQVAANEIVYTVHKEKFPQLREAMDVCRETIRLVFDKQMCWKGPSQISIEELDKMKNILNSHFTLTILVKLHLGFRPSQIAEQDIYYRNSTGYLLPYGEND